MGWCQGLERPEMTLPEYGEAASLLGHRSPDKSFSGRRKSKCKGPEGGCAPEAEK